MKAFNIVNRMELFAICTAFEYDIKKFILDSNNKIPFTEEMEDKAHSREKKAESNREILDQLDLGDYISLIVENAYTFGINLDKARKIKKYFEKIIPVRNRVMHTKPLELGDRSLILEILDSIDGEISWIEWNELKIIKKTVKENPNDLISNSYIPTKEITRIYHNLPEAEFDDTGYIGREKDRKEIKELILNNKNQIITIVGNGGVGKTALVVKVLYDLIDNPNCKFDCILWISLKTNTLSNGEFVQIKNNISSIPEIYSFAVKEIGDQKLEKSPKEFLLEFMEEFKVLLVLDNLETINTNEINHFLKSIPEKSKVLITSRHGLGELEFRKKLDGLEKKDTIVYFRELSKFYGLDLHKRNDKEIYDITGKILYSNPLSIKWYISGVFNGVSELELQNKKGELVNFCLSNIFEKLEESSKNILQLFLIEKKPLSYGIIDFYMNLDDVELKKSINELLSTYMVNISNSSFKLNDMSRDYISVNYPPTNIFMNNVYSKTQDLKRILQTSKVLGAQSPFDPRAISANLADDDKELATYYLQEALTFSKNKEWEKAIKMCLKAKNISPNYYEIYKIQAFIEAEHEEYYKAAENYDIALSKCLIGKERAIIYSLAAIFYTIKLRNLDRALEYINNADELLPNTPKILIDKSRILSYLGNYDQAEKLLQKAEEVVSPDEESLRMQNIIACRYADLYKRKSETIQIRDFEKKLEIIKKGIKKLDEVKKLDHKSINSMILLLVELSSMVSEGFSNEKIILPIICDKIIEYWEFFLNNSNPKKVYIYKFLEKYIELVPKVQLNKVKIFIDNIENEKKVEELYGFVINLKENYGFISRIGFSKSDNLYFSRSNAYEGIKDNDNVSFEVIVGANGKKKAINIRKK